MTPTTPPGPIAQKLLHMLARNRDQKIADLSAFAAGRQHAEELQKTAVQPNALVDMHPVHGIYTYVQNQVSIMSETITQLPLLDMLGEIVGKAEDEYMPSGPPMSPLTGSYFFCWAVFDATVGKAKETIGTCIVTLARSAGAHPEFVRLIEVMQQSRMGLYVHDGAKGDIVFLRELVTGARLQCVVPAGYVGERGEVWLARVLPPPSASFTESLVFTTPYVLRHPGEPQWLAYLERTLPKVRAADRKEAYALLMKYGLSINYWNEYIFEAYANHETSAVFLRGLPDVDESRPHSRKSEKMRDELHEPATSVASFAQARRGRR